MRPHLRRIVDRLRDLGAHDIAVAYGARHPRVVFWHGGVEHSRTVSGTPSDPDECVRRVVEDIRRHLGLIDHEKRVGEWRDIVGPPVKIVIPPSADHRGATPLFWGKK